MVNCYDEKGCRVVSSKPREGTMGDKASKNSQIHKTVQYIVKRRFGVAVREGNPLLLILVAIHSQYLSTSHASVYPSIYLLTY